MNKALAYVQERWEALICQQPAEQHARLWAIYAGGVAVGLAAAKDTSKEDIIQCALWLGQHNPPEIS